METIFDHSLTDEEMRGLLGGTETKTEYVRFANQDSVNVDLYRLFSRRGDEERAEGYLSKVEDPDLRFSASYSDLILPQA
jgi:hypothetical protein